MPHHINDLAAAASGGVTDSGCLQILSVSVFEKTEVSCALQADASQTDLPTVANQLNLFDI
jgi:hypothetical protein